MFRKEKEFIYKLKVYKNQVAGIVSFFYLVFTLSFRLL